MKNDDTFKELRWIEISRSALLHNIEAVKKRISSDTQLACIIKSNAYGHGLQETALIIQDRIDAFGVVDINEAQTLRSLNVKNKIINIGFLLPGDAEAVFDLNVIPVIYSMRIAVALENEGIKRGAKLDIVVKIETGMNRCGVCGTELDELMLFLSKCKSLNLRGLSTHFSKSDSDVNWTKTQLERFKAITSPILHNNLNLIQSANTGAIFLHPESHHNIVRLGIGLYGMVPSETVYKAGGKELLQVLEFKSRIIQIHSVKAGESVSYNGLWTAEKNSKIAIIPVGYADGYNRGLSNKGSVVIRGRKAKIAGIVCMNAFAVDISEIPDVQLYDTVTLISKEKQFGITPDDIAQSLNAINYEITTSLTEKIKRFVVD